jgi:uncharacterized SAM-binding protein YcdF (DUF218 family)
MLSIIVPLVSNLFLILWVSALIILWLSTKKNPGIRKAGLAFLIAVWLLGTAPVADLVLAPLERQYKTPKINDLKRTGVNQIVVLTGGGYPVQGELLASAFPPASLSRFASSLGLASRLGPNCKIIFSGTAGRGLPDRVTSEAMRQLAVILIPSVNAVAEKHSSCTAEHPAALKTMVHGPFVLVTSAYHMPRCMRSFKKNGLSPIPYPVDFQTRETYSWNDWIPSTETYWKLNLGLREYLALAFYWLKGC